MIEVIIEKFEIESKPLASDNPKEVKYASQVSLEFTVSGLDKREGKKSICIDGELDQNQLIIRGLNNCLGYIARGKMLTAESPESGHYDVIILKEGQEFKGGYEFKRTIEVPDAVLQAYFAAVGKAESTEVKLSLPPM